MQDQNLGNHTLFLTAPALRRTRALRRGRSADWRASQPTCPLAVLWSAAAKLPGGQPAPFPWARSARFVDLLRTAVLWSAVARHRFHSARRAGPLLGNSKRRLAAALHMRSQSRHARRAARRFPLGTECPACRRSAESQIPRADLRMSFRAQSGRTFLSAGPVCCSGDQPPDERRAFGEADAPRVRQGAGGAGARRASLHLEPAA